MMTPEPILYLVKGANVGIPAAGSVGLIVDSSGTLKTLASDGTATAVAGTGVDPGSVNDSGASALQNWTFTGTVSGDTDGDYEGELVIVVPAAIGGNYSFSFNANSAPANVVGFGQQMSNAGTTAAGGPSAALGLGRDPVGVGGGTLTCRWRLSSKSGRARLWTCDSIYNDAGGTNYSWKYNAQIPSATNTVITDLRVLCSAAGGIGAHSGARWRKLGFTA